MDFQLQELERMYSCTICEDPLRLANNSDLSSVPPVIVTKCGHMYHDTCLHDWFSKEHEKNEGVVKESTCPVCRGLVLERELIKIYLPVNNSRPPLGFKTKFDLENEIRTLEEEVSELKFKLAILESKQSTPHRQSEFSSNSDLTATCSNSSSGSNSSSAAEITPVETSLLENTGISHEVEETLNSTTVGETPNSTTGGLISYLNLIDLNDTDEEGSLFRFEAVEDEDDEIKIGTQVVWFSEDGADGIPYKGPVVWLGNVEGEQFAAVVFEEEIGNTDGIINNVRKFICDARRTRLIQLGELLLANYFELE